MCLYSCTFIEKSLPKSVDISSCMQGLSVTTRNGGIKVTKLWSTPTFIDTPTFIGFYLTDTVESVADPCAD